MKPRMKWIGIAAIGLGASALGYLWLRPASLAVETARVARGPLQVLIEEEGNTRVRDRYLVTAPVAGQVNRISLKEGDRVEAGAVVARLQPMLLDTRAREAAEARLAQAEDADRAARAQLVSTRTVLEQARRNRARADLLAAENALARAELEAAILDEAIRSREMESADFRQQATAHEAEAARAALASGAGVALILRAPVSGTVLRVPEASARVVGAGEPLLEIGDCGSLEIVTDLLSADAARVKPGARVLVDGWGGDTTLEGRVRRIEPSGFTKVSALGVEEQRVNVIGDLVEAPATLGDRYRARVRIVIWEGANVLKLPANALFRSGDQWNVFVMKEGRAQRRVVEIGRLGAAEGEVLQGLAEGDEVITSPGDRIRDGVRVKKGAPAP